MFRPLQWREQRSQNGEDSTDYHAFRQHVTRLGAPDPGAPFNTIQLRLQ